MSFEFIYSIIDVINRFNELAVLLNVVHSKYDLQYEINNKALQRQLQSSSS